ncbi:hypothetical protein EVAR_5276_1 [Eumeta japonica]|uniref:Uncharacterized protein n=1 Tax=Eumeta variegata TaxID=151549 RepID=A0A4C1TM27_EUMVA|nr:hypothetical protein EVAR_5276_1 [Eumeta japonica]
MHVNRHPARAGSSDATAAIVSRQTSPCIAVTVGRAHCSFAARRGLACMHNGGAVASVARILEHVRNDSGSSGHLRRCRHAANRLSPWDNPFKLIWTF